MARAPVTSRALKRAAGVSPERALPAFARSTFRRAFQRTHRDRDAAPPTGSPRRVILWPDTFNNHFCPEIAWAASHVLEAAGFNVDIPQESLCCGRPLYDFGMLDLARHQLRTILRVLRADIRAGTPIVVLEPSCASVFRDELPNMFPNDPDATRLTKLVFLFSEFMDRHDDSFVWPHLNSRALVHGHCHQKSVLGMTAELSVLSKLAIDATVLDSGCCGMAGAFGFETDHYDVSVACAERVLLPALREAAEDTLVITNGFSCREQITQLAGRKTYHLAEVINLGLEAQLRD